MHALAGLPERDPLGLDIGIDDRNRESAAGPEIDGGGQGVLGRNVALAGRGGLCRRRRLEIRGVLFDRCRIEREARHWPGRCRHRRRPVTGIASGGRRLRSDGTLIDLRHGQALDRDRRLRSLAPVALMQTLAQGHGRAGGQRHADILPVLAHRIFDHRPGLQAGLAGAAIDDPVGCLPDRRGDDIGNAHLALARARQLDLDRAGAVGAAFARGGHGLGDLRGHLRIVDRDGGAVIERDRIDRTGIGQQRDDPDDALLGAGIALGHAEHLAFERAAGARHLDLHTLQLADETGRRSEILGRERHSAKSLFGLLGPVERDCPDRAASIAHDEALEHVVDLFGADVDADRLIALDLVDARDLGEAAGGQGHEAHAAFGCKERPGGDGAEEGGGENQVNRHGLSLRMLARSPKPNGLIARYASAMCCM